MAAVARSFNRMAEELTARASALDASDRARRQLLADVSHELMTPLTAMRGYVETLAMPELQIDDETRRRYLAIVTEETHRLERIIGDLLDLARLEGGGGTMRSEPVDVAVAVRARGGAARARAARTGRHARPGRCRAARHRSSAIPTASNRRSRTSPPTRCGTPPDGGVDHAVGRRQPPPTRARSPQNAAIRLRVHDTGPGIAAEHLPLIFDRFYKVDTARKASGGSGLGLSIVKAIVERHGGTIVAYNAPDPPGPPGAVFEIVLPAPSE